MFCEPPADSSGLLRTEVQRQILFVLVSLSQSQLLLLGNDGQNPRNRQPHQFSANISNAYYHSSSNLPINNPKFKKIKIIKNYILESLLGAPPVTLATRRRASSALNSLSWSSNSCLVFCLNSWALTLAMVNNHYQTKTRFNSHLNTITKKVHRFNEFKISMLRLKTHPWRLLLLLCSRPVYGGN